MSSDSSLDEIASTRRTSRPKRVGWAVTLLAGGALAGAVLAGNLPAFAENSSSPSASSGSGSEQRDGGGRRDHNEVALTGDTAAKVKAAALAKVPGATVERVETDADGATYEAHLTKSDGSRVTVKLDASFGVTGVETGR